MADVLRFDIAKDPKGNPIVYGRVGDSNGLTRKVKVFDDGKPFDLTGWTTTFEGNTSKYKTKVFDSEGITVDDPTKGEFSYVFPNMAFAVEGQYERAYFSFTKNGIRRSSGDFEIIVFGNADINAAEAETVITEYNKLVAELQELQKNNIADLQEQQDTYIQSTDNTFAAIQGRITNLQNTIKGFETSADEVAETIQTRLSELAKRLDELELGVRLHDAYAWSADGADRFTTVYPGENLTLNSNFDTFNNFNGWSPDYGKHEIVDGVYKKTFTISYDATRLEKSVVINEVGYYIFSVLIKTTEAVSWRNHSGVLVDPIRTDYPPTDGYQIHQFVFKADTTGTKLLRGYIPYAPIGTVVEIAWEKLEKTSDFNDRATIYTPAPSEDYANAYPSYKGISIVDSDNPADYLWQAEDNTIAKKATLDSHTENISNPHKVTKDQVGLGNVPNYAAATDAEAITGAATNKLITPKNLQTFYEDRQKISVARFGLSDLDSTSVDKFSDASWRYRRIGNEVEFFGRFKFSSATDIVNVHNLPTGFRLSTDFDDTSWNLPLTVSKAANPTAFLASGFVERVGTNLLRIGCNATGNTYWYGSWYTDDPFPIG